MSSKEALLTSIHPDMKLDKAFFLKVYGYEITWPGFAETAIKALEGAGCSRARQYYDSIVGEYEKGYQEQIKEVGAWYLRECQNGWEKRRKEGEERRTEQKEMELLKRKKQLLKQKLQRLTRE